MQQNQSIMSGEEGNSYDFREQLDRYLNHWLWFVLGVSVMLTAAFFYLRYAVPQYKATTTILVKDEKKGGMASELSAFADLGVLAGGKSNVDNEIEILKSRTLIESTVKELGLNVSYIVVGHVRSADIYKNAPVEILFSKVSEKFSDKTNSFRLEDISNSSFIFYDDSRKVGKFNFGQPITCKEGTCTILKKEVKSNDKKNKDNLDITIQINPLEQVVEGFKSRLTVAPLSKTTSIAELSIVDPVEEKAEDFLNTLVRIYNRNAIEDKNFISENTSKFIEQRLKFITDELDGVEKEAEVFKKTNQVTDITSEAGLYLQNATDFEKKEIEVETQLKVVKYMTDYVSKSDISSLIPANVLTSDSKASGLIDQYNQLVLERNRLLKNAGPSNSVLLALNNKIEALKSNVMSGLAQQKSALEINRNDMARQNAIVGGRISKIPTLEREARGLGRQQQIKETLYLYLLQKREETAISLVVTEPNAKVIDAALTAKLPVAPKKNIIYLAALLLGLLLPFTIIYLMDLLDTKVKLRSDVDGKLGIPFLGDVPNSESHTEIINATSRTGTAEALRIIRTNLEFMLNQVPDGIAKTIFTTSTVPKEGKTFIAVNLAGTIALSGKKVLLIGMDIRNPKLNEYLDLPSKGVTNYLSTKEGTIKDYIVKQKDFEQFYVLPAGIIPPNPAELLMGKNVDALFEELKKEYDYIVVDTAPVSLVTDTLQIAKHADTFIYVVRANYLDKRMLIIPQNLYKEHKLGNMAILLNDTRTSKGYGYGYGYGYGVEEVKIPWYKQLFNKVKNSW